MAKSKKSFVEAWEIKPVAAVLVAGGFLSWIWFLIDDNIIAMMPNFPRYATIALAIAVVGLLQFSKVKTRRQGEILRVLTHFVGVATAFIVFWEFWYYEYLTSADWFRDITLMTGRTGIAFLMLSLACTPLVTLFGWSSLNAVKKPTGNWGFAFVVLHLIMFTFDYGLVNGGINAGAVVQEAFLKQYAVIGFIAFLLLVPLAATSNKWAMKKLGKKWKQLHKLVYLINILAVTHFLWVKLSKLDLARPLTYAIVVAFLLFVRIPAIKTRIRDFKRARKAKARAAQA